MGRLPTSAYQTPGEAPVIKDKIQKIEQTMSGVPI
jgi:hypothetical protein